MIGDKAPSRAYPKELTTTYSTDFAALILWQQMLRDPVNRTIQSLFAEEYSRLKTANKSPASSPPPMAKRPAASATWSAREPWSLPATAVTTWWPTNCKTATPVLNCLMTPAMPWAKAWIPGQALPIRPAPCGIAGGRRIEVGANLGFAHRKTNEQTGGHVFCPRVRDCMDLTAQ